MKKSIALLLAMVIACTCLTACNNKDKQIVNGEVAKVDISKESPDSYFQWSEENATKIIYLSEEGLKQKSIVVPAKCTEISSSAFKHSEVLESVAFASDSLEIHDIQFSQIKTLKTVVLPGAITTIPKGCFSMSGIENVQIPSTVTTIEEKAFSNCTSLKSIDLSNTSITVIKINTFFGCDVLESVTLPDTVKVIEESAFSGSHLLANINFPEGLKEIQDEAFRHCHGIQKVTLPKTVISVGDFSFGDCGGLAEIYLPESLQVIPKSAFYKMGVGSVEGYVQLTVYVKEGSYADTAYDEYYDGSMKKAYY